MEVLGSKGSQLPLSCRDLVASGFAVGGLLDDEGRVRDLRYSLEKKLLRTLAVGAMSNTRSVRRKGQGGFRDG